MSSADTTTSISIESTPKAAQRRVNKKWPSGRCLIENVHPYNSVNYCYCLDRSTDSSILTELERAWGMKPNTLNLDTRYNIIRLGENLHNLFEKAEWILVPEEHIIQSYYAVKDDPTKFPDINNKTYKYRFLPHPNMRVSLIHRQHCVKGPQTVVTTDDSTTHSFPFNDLGLVESHIHPKFVITKIGQSFNASGRFYSQYLIAHPHFFQSLSRILIIYGAWTRQSLDAYSSEAYDLVGAENHGEERNDDDDESNSNETKPRRAILYPRVKRKRKPTGGPGPDDGDNDGENDNDSSISNSDQTKPRRVKIPVVRQRNREEPSHGPWLDDETLHELDKGTHGDKTAKIQSWLSGLQSEE